MLRLQGKTEPLVIKIEQEEPKHLEIKLFKVEDNQPFFSPDEEQLLLKQETGDILVTPSNVQRISDETEPNSNQKLQRKHHQDQNLFACKICDKIFTLNSKLTKHMRSHSGEKSYSHKTSRKSLDLDNTTHTEKKLSSCVICRRSFRNKSNLNNHMKIHRPQKTFSCPTCKKTFTQKSNLTTHLRIHTGKKPFSCVTCGKKFRNKSHLISHMRIHTGEKPFTCMTCGKSFTQIGHLGTHMKSHTGEKAFQPYVQRTNGLISQLSAETKEQKCLHLTGNCFNRKRISRLPRLRAEAGCCFDLHVSVQGQFLTPMNREKDIS
uniref:C2H2-type domain-containing protein n=1 Tax=Poecilia latipinna TaxID=48699 RepID=A0A3B3VH16_9TELE